MFRKMVMAAPLAGVLALSPAALDQQAHAAQFSPPSDYGSSPLLQLVRSGGVIMHGGGGGGGGGGRGSFGGGGRMGGFGGGPAFRGGMGYGGAGRSFNSFSAGRSNHSLGVSRGPVFRDGGASIGRRSFDRPGRFAVRSFDRMPRGGFDGSSGYIRRGDGAHLYKRDFSNRTKFYGNGGRRNFAHNDHDGNWRGKHDRRHHRLRRFSHFFFFGPGYDDYYYDYATSYYNDCEWLRLRAISTGSVYWWRRYRQCEDWY